MRTTIDIPDALANEAKTYMKAHSCTMRDLVSEGLRFVLIHRKSFANKEFTLRQAEFSGPSGFAPGVDADSVLREIRDQDQIR
jgi:hypothetical protein